MATSSHPRVRDDLFDAAFLRRVEHLALLARRISSSGQRANRRSKTIGAGIEFADHRAYNEVVRELAGEGDHLLDLERAYAELDEQELGRIFRADGIHFTPAGLDRIGRDIAAFVRQQGLVE